MRDVTVTLSPSRTASPVLDLELECKRARGISGSPQLQLSTIDIVDSGEPCRRSYGPDKFGKGIVDVADLLLQVES